LGLGAIVSGEIGLTQHCDSAWPTFLEFFGAWSFIIGCFALFPFKSHGFANDGMLLRALLFRKEEALPMIASYALSAVKNDSVFPPDYAMRWFRLASAQTELQKDNYCACWLGYVAAQDEATAAEFLERCLAHSATMDEDQRDKLVAEATVFTAWRKNNSHNAEVWFQRIKSGDRIHVVWLSRVKIALLCAHGEFEAATIELDRALSLIRAEPASSQRQKCESEWITWRQQIQERCLVDAPS
jgi:hypothetical protein